MTQEHLNDPIMSTELRERIVSFLDTFSDAYGSELASQLWSDDMRDASLTCAAVINADVAIWNADDTELAPIFNGPRAESLVGKITQPLNKGIISMVYATEQTFSTSDVRESKDHDPEVDQLIGIESCHLLASPLYFGAALRGVVSSVRFIDVIENDPKIPPAFSEQDVTTFETMVRVLGNCLIRNSSPGLAI